MSYASIVPLIGGETIAMQNAFGKRPEYILSYSDFTPNDNHLIEYYNKEVPYHLINEGKPDVPSVDVVNTVCPCAGLSSLSTSSSSDAAANDWMRTSANYILEHIQPKVFWGENAPRLASKMGKPIVKSLREIGKKYGYSFSIYKTKSILHGLSQVRDRTFYFFWKGDKVPRLSFIDRKYERIEDAIRKIKLDKDDPMNVPANKELPTDNPYYKYLLEEVEGGITHQQFYEKIDKSIGALEAIESSGVKYRTVAEWMRKKGYDKYADKCERMHDKLESGGNIMRKTTLIPKDYIGAFVGHLPAWTTHPDENRYLTIRECLSLMKLPDDFILQGGVKNLNHICQNVPVTTAQDMAEDVKAFVDGRLNNQMFDTDFLIQDNKSKSFDYEKYGVQLDEFMV